MTPTPRQSGIIQAASVDGHQTIEALAERFNVTHQTIRRDVNRLANAGLIARFHGGVRLLESTTENIAYRQRQAIAAGAKQRIARAIAA
ncbi:MAG: DeoR family transcriptional regulator, partial [Burkholderiaceae bacterium]|nr:DeoR family transcriptional regulator [Burkholderiaceae bacterium]